MFWLRNKKKIFFCYTFLTKVLVNVFLLFPLQRHDFFQLLRDTPDITRHSKWNDVKRKIDHDPRFKAVDSSARREDWFKDYVRDLGVCLGQNFFIS